MGNHTVATAGRHALINDDEFYSLFDLMPELTAPQTCHARLESFIDTTELPAAHTVPIAIQSVPTPRNDLPTEIPSAPRRPLALRVIATTGFATAALLAALVGADTYASNTGTSHVQSFQPSDEISSVGEVTHVWQH